MKVSWQLHLLQFISHLLYYPILLFILFVQRIITLQTTLVLVSVSLVIFLPTSSDFWLWSYTNIGFLGINVLFIILLLWWFGHFWISGCCTIAIFIIFLCNEAIDLCCQMWFKSSNFYCVTHLDFSWYVSHFLLQP